MFVFGITLIDVFVSVRDVVAIIIACFLIKINGMVIKARR